MNEQINLMDILNMAVKRWKIIVLAVCLAGVMTFVISSYFITPQFTSSGKLIVSDTLEKKKDQLLDIIGQLSEMARSM